MDLVEYLHMVFISVFPNEFIRAEKGKRCVKRNSNVLKQFIVATESVDDAVIARDECEEYCEDSERCWGCSVHCEERCQWNAISECGGYDNWNGLTVGDISQKASKFSISMQTRYFWNNKSSNIKLIQLPV